MKVVALVSGGKDSTMNMLECIRHGHEIIALANLHPPADSPTDELDSFMYQSVGWDAISAFADCTGLPLFRQEIRGTARNQSFDYSETDGDEVEDLARLLRNVKERLPEVEGVSSGAIHSAYQKNRVEHVCARLGLVSLAFLWGRDQKTLLRSMIEAGIDAVLIKTAVMGLDQRHLMRSIAEMEPVMLRLEQQYGVNVCGEGGEYETLTLDAPMFKERRLEVVAWSVVEHRASQFAPVTYAKIRSMRTVRKDGE